MVKLLTVLAFSRFPTSTTRFFFYPTENSEFSVNQQELTDWLTAAFKPGTTKINFKLVKLASKSKRATEGQIKVPGWGGTLRSTQNYRYLGTKRRVQSRSESSESHGRRWQTHSMKWEQQKVARARGRATRLIQDAHGPRLYQTNLQVLDILERPSGYRRESPSTSGLVYQHMSSHYRRILNAKPAVDTSTPESFKLRAFRSAGNRRYSHHRVDSRDLLAQSDHHLNPRSYQPFIDRVVPDKTCNPAEACRPKWPANKRPEYGNDLQKNAIFYRSSQSAFTSGKGRKLGDVLERDENCFKSYRLEYWPRILKTDATSKLRSMRVYHPPRRKPKGVWGFEEEEKRDCGCVGECACSEPAGKEQSPASSRDSAYNGGNSSTTDSRSPTPYRHRHTATQTDPRPRRRHQTTTALPKKRTDDIQYTKFIHEITSEAVGSGQFTDKSLTRIIEKHIRSNLHRLDKEIMLREVSKLKSELGISTEDIEEHEVIPKLNADLLDVEFESWTAHYLQLMNGNRPCHNSTNSIGSDISERITNLNLSDNDESDSDNNDSDSSRGTTIKEVVQNSSIQSSIDDPGSEESFEESIDTGSSSSDEDDSPK